MPKRNLTIIFLAVALGLLCYHQIERNRYAAVFANALDQISSQYVNEVDRRKLFDAAMTGMVRELDEYSDYIDPQQYSRFQESLDQQFGGIGIEVTLDPQTKRLTVLSPLIGTPAYKVGMRAGDTILAINGKSTEDFQLKDAVELLRGQPETEVTVTVRHKGETEPIDMHVVRAVIQVESVLGDTRKSDGSWNFYLEDDPRIGYVRIATFGEHTEEELSRVLRFKDHPVEAIILDLRGNPGGLLSMAIAVCNMFLDQGTIVSTVGRGGEEKERFIARPERTIVPRDIPVAVLVNHYSASASEIVAACLQDNHRAVIIGQRTWGKGTVQNVIPLEGGRSILKLTTASYWRPSGRNIHRTELSTEDGEWGVRPDDGFEVKLSDDEFEQVLKWRRDRDVVRPDEPTARKDDSSDLPPTDDVPPEKSPAAAPAVDPQLQRAVDYLREELARRERAPQKA